MTKKEFQLWDEVALLILLVVVLAGMLGYILIDAM